MGVLYQLPQAIALGQGFVLARAARSDAVQFALAVGHTRLCPVPTPLAKMTLQRSPTSVRASGGVEGRRVNHHPG